MQNEPFIMKTVERAREWVDAYSLSTQVDKEESANILAMLCGFGSWDVMVFAIESMPPTACDESVGEETVAQRKESYMHVFVCLLNVRPAIALFFVNRLSPSANAPFESFTIDEALAEEEALEDEDENDEIEGLPDPIRLFTSARLCGQVSVQGWCTGLEFLGWDIDVDSLDPEADIGEPSFVVKDVNLGTVPVYLSGLSRIPETDDDPAAKLFMKACLGDFMMQYGSDDHPQEFLILWKDPQHKKIGGKDYCCIGVRFALADERWKDVLVSQHCDSPDRLFELNDSFDSIASVEFCEEAEDLADEDSSLGNLLAVVLAGFPPMDQTEDGWMIERRADEESGWGLLRALDPVEVPTSE